MESSNDHSEFPALILHLERDTAILVRERLMYSQQSLQDDRPKIQEIIDAIDNYLQSHLGGHDAITPR